MRLVFVVKDNPSNPAKRKLMVLSIDAAVELGPGNGSADDPTLSPKPVDVVLTTGKKRYCMTFNGKQLFKPGKSFFTTNSPAAWSP